MRASPGLVTVLWLGLAAVYAQQKIDSSYTAKIKEYTTEPFFLTELVDHLPASDKVPTPEKFLGYVIGAPNRLTYAKDVYRFMREVEKSSARVKVMTIGKTEEGREIVVVAVSSEENLKRLARLKEITSKLADPRTITDEEAGRLTHEGLPLYWVTAAIHSPETGSPEMLMELVYRLAVEETPLVQNIRNNLVTLITPAIEVDGRERQVDLYRWRKENPNRTAPSLLYWGKYVAHDNNRDGMVLSLELSKASTRFFLEYHPQVEHDLHESVPFLYISTGMGPYNAWLDPIVISEWQKMAYHEVEEMTRRGVPGVWTQGFYDGWAANYLFTVAHGHNAIGRFYETFGNGGADTRERTLGASQTSRQWYRPNPPLSKVKWSMRNNINLQQSALLLALNYTASNREVFLRNFYLKSKRSVAKATTEGPAGYVISSAERPNEAASLARLLKLHGIEVHRLSQETEIAGVKHPAGAYAVRMDQPYSRMADMLLDRQYYNANDTPPYDDTGWTLTALRNLKSTRVTSTELLKAPMVKLDDHFEPEGRVEGDGNWLIVNHNGDRVLASFRFALKDVAMSAAEAPFEANGRKFNAGSFVINGDGGVRRRVEAAAAEWGIRVQAVGTQPSVPMHDLAAPRIALVHTWTSTQNEGWYRLAFDNTRIPYTYISDHVLRQTPNLREKFDVIIFGPVGGSAQRIVNGMLVTGDPVPWKASDLTPNFGTSPDQTDDIRGGMGLEGVTNIRNFVNQGGLFVTIGSNAAIPIDFALIDGVSITPARELKVRGSVLEAAVADPKSPITYGYDPRFAVYFNSAPVFQVNPYGTGFGQGQGGGARPSGRGGVDDPDVAQARPYVPPVPEPKPRPGEVAPPNPETIEFLRPFVPPADMLPRTVVRFSQESSLLISGMLAGGGELANRPAVIDVPRGKGHFLLFANNPVWREQTQGSYMLLLNAAMNFNSLQTGRSPAPTQSGPGVMADDVAQDNGHQDHLQQ
ncbi:MAG: hypothetical protein IT161_04010 [Bryobacterales bacterium]|nr:hypothetical protein [Bryobacterales bacterium]